MLEGNIRDTKFCFILLFIIFKRILHTKMIEALYQHIIKNDKLRFEKGPKGLVFQKKRLVFPLLD